LSFIIIMRLIFSLKMQTTNVNTQLKASVAKVVKAAGKKKVT